MALNNCTINSASVEVAKNAQVSSTASQVLTITPNHGYRVKAADFTAQSPPTGIASITLADSVGANYESNNTVTVTCDLTNTYNPGNSDVTLTIDIDGNAVADKDVPNSIAGTHGATLSNVTGGNVKGTIKIARVADTSKYKKYNVTNVVDGTGYWKLTVSENSFSPGSISPLGTFPHEDPVVVTLTDGAGNAYSGFTNKTYDWDQNTSDSDPGAGELKGNNTGLSNITTIYIDEVDQTSANLDSQFTTLMNAAAQQVSYLGTAYSGSGIEEANVDLFSKTFTAVSGYYFPNEPSYSAVDSSGVDVLGVDRYVVNESTTLDGNGNLTAKTFDVNGIIPAANITGDVIHFTANAVVIPASTNNITSYSINTSDAPYSLTKRRFIVYGDVGATFTLTITRSGDSHTYNFSTNDFTSSSTNSGTLTVASNGQHLQLITLPVITSDVTYTFTLAAVSPTSLSLTQSNNFTIARKGFKSVTVNATSSDRGTFQSKTITYTNHAGTSINQSGGSNSTYGQSGEENESENSAEFNFNIIVDDDQAFVFSSDSTINSLTLNSGHYSITPSSGKAVLSEGSIVATRSADSGSNANQLLTLVGTDWYNWTNGTSDTVITVDIDDFCLPGSGSGGNVLDINSTVFQDITGGSTALLYPSGYIQNVTGRTSGSSTITYTLAGVQIASPSLPSYVDNIGDLTITATTVTSTSTDKFDSANFATNITSHSVANAGTGNAVVTFDVTITVTSFSPAVASNDELGLKVMIAFSDVSQ